MLGKNIFQKIKKAWKNRAKIIEGIRYKYFPSSYVEQIAAKRDEICKMNICGYYDKKGASSKCFVPGQPCCSACGCKLAYKQRSLSSDCGLAEIEGKIPLWKSEMHPFAEEAFRARTGLKNE